MITNTPLFCLFSFVEMLCKMLSALQFLCFLFYFFLYFLCVHFLLAHSLWLLKLNDANR